MKLNHRLFSQSPNPLSNIVILHGLLGSSQNWISTAKELSNSNAVYTLDLRNHGKSFHANSMQFSDLANDIIEWLQENSIENPILIGHSLGGKTSMHLACNNPDLIKKLIVIDISPKKYNPHHKDAFDAMNRLDLSKTKTRKDAADFLENYIQDHFLRQFLLTNLIFRLEQSPKWQINLPVLTDNQEVMTENPLKDTDSFTKPTLFIKCNASDFMTDSDFAAISKYFPNYTRKDIENCGHNPHIEKKAEFLEILKEFI